MEPLAHSVHGGVTAGVRAGPFSEVAELSRATGRRLPISKVSFTVCNAWLSTASRLPTRKAPMRQQILVLVTGAALALTAACSSGSGEGGTVSKTVTPTSIPSAGQATDAATTAVSTDAGDEAGGSATFRGDAARTGVFHATGELKGEERWHFATGGPVRSSAAVAAGMVYVGSEDGNLYAVDAKTGAEKWHFATDGAVSSSPHVADGVVYFTSEDGKVYAVSAADGELRWERQTAGPKVFGLQDWEYFSASPLARDGVVYVGSRGSDTQFYALDAADGSVKWSVQTGNKGVRTAPAFADDTLYVTTLEGKIMALNPADGTEKWAAIHGVLIHSTPAVADGLIYYGSRMASTYAVDAATGKVRWMRGESEGSWVESSPAVADGVVYIGGSDSHEFHALDAATGKDKWTVDLKTNLFTSPAVVGDTVYIASGDAYQEGADGALYALDTATGDIRWSFGAQNFFSSPVVAGDTLYIGNDDGNLYALK